MRTFWMALLDPAEKRWGRSVFLGVWTAFAVFRILDGGGSGWF